MGENVSEAAENRVLSPTEFGMTDAFTCKRSERSKFLSEAHVMRVLLASDGSSDSMKAARFVKELARKNPVDVHVVTVSCVPGNVTPNALCSFATGWEEQDKKQVQELHAELLLLLSETCDSVIMSRTVGPVATTILDESVGLEADLIVMGACGHSLVHRMLLGSISDHVATHAKCSVVVVRTEHEEGLVAMPRRLLVGFDRSKGSREAIAEMMKVHWPVETHLDVLSVAPQPLPFESDPFAVMDYTWEPKYLENIRTAAERMASRAAESIRNCSVHITRSNHAGDAIVHAAEESGSDMIIIGDTGHTFLDEWLLGSTSKFVLRHAKCSVWISRHHRKNLECINDPREAGQEMATT